MTANELADKLQNEKANTLLYVATIVDSATMLRQQQAKIEKLGSELNRIVELYTDKAIENEALKLRELTDEEIYKLADEHLVAKLGSCGEATGDVDGQIDFARAILKKAREK